MTLAPHDRSTFADLLRLLAGWLAVIVLVQGLAAAFALGTGPLHRHRGAPAASMPAHHHHDSAERHHHSAFDASVLPDTAEASFDAAAFAITAALALMALAVARPLSDGRCHVWRTALSWAWRCTFPALLLKPPRPG